MNRPEKNSSSARASQVSIRAPRCWRKFTTDAAPPIGLDPVDGDRRYFREHPTRRHRVRPAWPGEAETLGCPSRPGMRAWILTTKISDIVRIRSPVVAPEQRRLPDDEAFGEALARKLGIPDGRSAASARDGGGAS